MNTLLTKYSGAILGPIALVLGFVLGGIYDFIKLITGGHVENVGISIIILTIIIYSCLYPLTYKQQKFSRLTQKMSPELQEIKKKYEGKRDQESMQQMNMETQAVYQKYGVSATGSCLQFIIQMPILFALYRVFYNVPAYISSVKNIFITPSGSSITDQIMNTPGWQDKMTNLVAGFKNLSALRADFFVAESSTFLGQVTSATERQQNFIVDVLYKLPKQGWETLTSSAYFPNLTNADAVEQTVNHVNNFLGLNISYTPWDYISSWFNAVKDGTGASALFGFAFLALLIPVFSYLSQVLSIKVMPQANTTGNEQMGAQMKSMNLLMPLMSFVICFTVPVGLGIYWIGSALVRTVQALIINKKLDKIDLEDIIEKNKEKAKKKREKMGIYENQIRNNAQLRTKTNVQFKSLLTDEEKEQQLSKASEIKANARTDSMAYRANLVKEFNERNSADKKSDK